MALFGSVYFASLFASLKTTFGGSVFHVTPKTAGKVSFASALRQNKVKLIASVVLAALVDAASGSVFAVVLIITPASVSYTHLRAHETRHDLVCRLLLEKKKKTT